MTGKQEPLEFTKLNKADIQEHCQALAGLHVEKPELAEELFGAGHTPEVRSGVLHDMAEIFHRTFK